MAFIVAAGDDGDEREEEDDADDGPHHQLPVEPVVSVSYGPE